MNKTFDRDTVNYLNTKAITGFTKQFLDNSHELDEMKSSTYDIEECLLDGLTVCDITLENKWTYNNNAKEIAESLGLDVKKLMNNILCYILAEVEELGRRYEQEFGCIEGIKLLYDLVDNYEKKVFHINQVYYSKILQLKSPEER